MGPKQLVTIVWIFVTAIFATSTFAQERVAFIVGNSVYEHAAPLANPGNDAHLIARTLTALNFDVRLHENLSRWKIASELSDFLDETKDAELTIFYFAGHGMQFEGGNYLLGTDAQLRSELDVEAETLNLDHVIRLLRRGSRAALVFVDACRDNPIATAFYQKNFSATRALATRGLAPARSSFDGAMVTFAASPGQVAYDGAGINSPFASALARHLPTPNIEILTLMKRVARDVRKETNDQQTPMVNNDLTREIFLREVASSARVNDLALEEPGKPELPEILTPKEMELTLNLTEADRRNLQRLLYQIGYDPGPSDGAFGPKTRTALEKFQFAHGLHDTGYVTNTTLDALRKTVNAAPSSLDGTWELTLNRRVVDGHFSSGMVAIIGIVTIQISGRKITILEEKNLSGAPRLSELGTQGSLSKSGSLQLAVTVNHIPFKGSFRRVTTSVELPSRALVGQVFEFRPRQLNSDYRLEPKLRRISAAE